MLGSVVALWHDVLVLCASCKEASMRPLSMIDINCFKSSEEARDALVSKVVHWMLDATEVNFIQGTYTLNCILLVTLSFLVRLI